MNAKRQRIEKLIDVLLSDRESYEGSKRRDLSRLWKNYLSPFRVRIYLALAVTAVGSLFPYSGALLTRFLVDHVLLVEGQYDPGMMQQQMPLFIRYVIFLFGNWTLFVVSIWIKNWLILGTGQKMIYEIRKELHEKLQSLHIGYFESHETGKIVSRILDDVKIIQVWATTEFLMFSANVFRLAMGLGVIFFLDWQLSLLIIAAMPLYVWAYIRIKPIIRRTSIAVRRLNSNMYGLSAERISGIGVVKAFAQEKREVGSFALLVNNLVRLSMRVIRYTQRLSLAAGIITALVSGLIIYIGATLIRAGTMTFGDVMAFIQIMPNIFVQVTGITSVMTRLEGVFVVLRRVFYLLDEFEEVEPGKIMLDGMKGKVDFNNITFSYPGQTGNALKDVSFHIEPGERIALMGPSGAGKTTIFQLLSRFYDPQEGNIQVGGVNLFDSDSSSLRHHVRMVQQEPVVFSGTIADNIAYGDLDANPAMIMTATKQAELHRFIMTLPAKYETEVGRNGIALSGGQKQRLALSTALLTQPEILLLDDTTSALDAETERRIRLTLNNILEGQTSIIITQRIATARNCNRIFVFEDGELTQQGSHDELLAKEGFYKRIYLQQESI